MSWVIIFCSFLGAFCLLVGMLIGTTWERHSAAKDEEREEREEAMARRTRPAYRQPGPAVYTPPAYAIEASDKFAAIREAGRQAWRVQQERDASVELYPGQALAVVGDDPTVTAWTQAMAAGMDAWLAEHVYGVPYSADELWSGQ